LNSWHRLRFRGLVNSLLALLGLALLAMVLWRDRGAIRELASRRPSLRLLVLALALTQLNLCVALGRWAILVRALDRRVSVRMAMLLGFIGYAFNLVIPGAVGGDVVKAAYLAQMQIKRTQAIASMLLDRLLGLLGLLCLAAGAGVLAWNPGSNEIRRLIVAAWALLGFGALLFVAIFLQPPLWSIVRRAALGHSRLSMAATELQAMSYNYRRRPGRIAAGLVLSLLSHSLSVIVFFVLGKALFGVRLVAPLDRHFLMVPLILLTMALPLPFGALGLSEEVGSHLLGLVGHPSGAVVMLVLRLLMVLCALEGMLVFLLRIKDVRKPIGEARPQPARSTREEVCT
jgi:uncharacterized protein (TIRG00374 family)